jgi:hypothetical protein
MSLKGDIWTITRGRAIARVKDSRGLQLLARLVERPDQEVHVLALASDEGVSAPESDAGDVIDEQARKAYRKRLTELEAAVARARQVENNAVADRLEHERDALAREIARASGLRGRTRNAGSVTERARINVQRRLKDAITRVLEVDPMLGTFLESAVRTGTYCCFRV